MPMHRRMIKSQDCVSESTSDVLWCLCCGHEGQCEHDGLDVVLRLIEMCQAQMPIMMWSLNKARSAVVAKEFKTAEIERAIAAVNESHTVVRFLRELLFFFLKFYCAQERSHLVLPLLLSVLPTNPETARPSLQVLGPSSSKNSPTS